MACIRHIKPDSTLAMLPTVQVLLSLSTNRDILPKHCPLQHTQRRHTLKQPSHTTGVQKWMPYTRRLSVSGLAAGHTLLVKLHGIGRHHQAVGGRLIAGICIRP
jgi:hypothetical protein